MNRASEGVVKENSIEDIEREKSRKAKQDESKTSGEHEPQRKDKKKKERK
jgi:hypothetical protein